MIRILIIENDEASITRIDILLKRVLKTKQRIKKYEVKFINNYNESFSEIEKGIYALALIDLQIPYLGATAESKDDSEYLGTKLISTLRKYNKDTIVGAYTGFAEVQTKDLVQSQVHGILDKTETDQILGKELEKLIDIVIDRINPDIDTNCQQILEENGQSIQYGSADQLDICLRKIFSIAEGSISYNEINGGYSGACIVAAYQDERLPKILKIFKYDELKKEVTNYNRYVKDFIPKRAQTSLDDIAQAGDIGILAYSFVGPEEIKSTLGQIIEEDNIDAVTSSIANFFDKNLERWFKRTKNIAKPDRLDLKCKQHLCPDIETIYKLLFLPIGHFVIDKTLSYLFPNSRDMTDDQFIEKVIDSIAKERKKVFCCPNTFIHGDLNINNLIWDDGKLWMIDFAKTGEGPRMIDFAKLEASLKYDIIVKFDDLSPEEQAMPLVGMEQLLLKPNGSNKLSIKSPEINTDIDANALHPYLRNKMKTIATVRHCAAAQCGTEGKIEYSLCLLYVTGKYVEYMIRDIKNQKPNKWPQLVHALASLSLIADMIDKKEALP